MPSFVSLEFNTCNEIILLMFLVTQVLFVCVLWQHHQILALWNTIIMLFVFGMDIGCSKYNVKRYGKHENILFSTCLLYLYLPPNWVG